MLSWAHAFLTVGTGPGQLLRPPGVSKLLDEEVKAMAKHVGKMLSGEVTCSCGGWTSGHYALASDAYDAFQRHLAEVENSDAQPGAPARG